MNRRTLYGSAYLLVSTGLLTAGFTSYAAAPDLTCLLYTSDAADE